MLLSTEEVPINPAARYEVASVFKVYSNLLAFGIYRYVNCAYAVDVFVCQRLNSHLICRLPMGKQDYLQAPMYPRQ